MSETMINMNDNNGTIIIERGERLQYISFLNYMAEFYGLINTLDIKVLALLMLTQDHNGNIALAAEHRKDLVSLLEISNSRLSTALNNLRALNLLSGKGGKFRLSDSLPRVLGKDITVTINFKA